MTIVMVLSESKENEEGCRYKMLRRIQEKVLFHICKLKKKYQITPGVIVRYFRSL